jgi:hypothetical protein
MAKQPKQTAEPIPEPWLARVIHLLEQGDPKKIIWSGRALMDWQEFGMKHDAYALCLEVLRSPTPIGQQIHTMDDRIDHSLCETWAFPCPHPCNPKTYLYAKIGLHHGQLRINLFSLHVDLSGDLVAAIRTYLKSKK